MDNWIDVDEKLPRANKKVLVVTKHGKHAIAEMYWNINGKKVWTGSSTFMESIVAWMDIPQYKRCQK